MPKDQEQFEENVLLAWRRQSQKAQQESLAWYSGDDPVLSKAVYQARLRLHHYTTGEIEQAISLLTSLIERELSLPEVKHALGLMFIDDQGEVYEAEGPVEIDPVDLLMLTYPRVFKASGDKVDTLEKAMMLLTLREARANRLGVALKAFYVGSHKRAEDGHRNWLAVIDGRRKGGQTSGATKREADLGRNEKMTKQAVGRLKNGDDPGKIRNDLAQQYGISPERVGQIVRKHPQWPKRPRKAQRSHT